MGVRRVRLAAASAVALVGSVLVAAAPAEAHGGHGISVEPVITGLISPRGVDIHGAKLVYSVGDGSVHEAWVNGRKIRKLGQVPGGFAPAIDTSIWGTTYALTGAGGEPGAPPAPGSTTLYKLRPGSTPLAVANIGRYQAKDLDPYDTEGHPGESNPFGVAALKDGSVLVADAAGNDLLRVWPNGHIKTVARIKPRTVRVPAGLPATDPAGNPLPPAGTPIPSESVPTSVTVGADGYWYVGELRGFPATPDTSQIWRIKPGSYGAVCDPAKPHQGKCQRYADGYTSIVDLDGGPRGALAVVELARDSWLQWELGGSAIGSLFVQWPGKWHKAGPRKELARGTFVLPAGVAFARWGDLYVSSPIFGPGAIYRVG